MSTHAKTHRLKIDHGLLAALALALPIILMTPLLSGELPGTHDAQLHLHRLVSAALNWREGVIWGRWSPQLHFGYGYPIGNFYAPGWHIAGGALVALGAPAVTIWLLFEALGVVIYVVGGYLWGRQIGGRAGALVGAAAFAYAPLRFFELFSQGNLSQFLAMGLMAWVMWALARCARQPSPARMATAALLLAALIVTHHVTALIFVPVAALYALAAPLIAGRRPWATLAAFALGLLAAAVYWLPAGMEIQYVGLQGAANQYPYTNAFIPLTDLIAPVTAADPAALNPPFPISVGVPQLVLAALGLVAALLPRARLDRWQRAHALAGAGGLLACLFLVSPQSARVWEVLTPLQNVLFPWRFLGLAALAVIPGVVVAVHIVRQTRLAAWAAIALTVAAALPVMQPRYANVHLPDPVTPGTSIRYEGESGNLGAVATAEYTPRWAEQRPLAEFAPEFFDDWRWNIPYLRGSLPAGVTVESEDSERRTGTLFITSAPEAFALDLHQFYFPGWQASLDGAPVVIETAPPGGTMRIQIPAGEHVVEVWYAGTDAQHLGDVLTLASLLVCGVLLTRRRAVAPTAYADDDARTGTVVALAAVVFALVYAGLVGSTPATAAYAPPANLTVQVGGEFVDAEGTPQIELIGLHLSQVETIRAGEWLYVDLYWRALQPLAGGWRVALTLIDPTLSIVWAQSNTGAPGGFDTATWPTDRYVVDRHILRVRADGEAYVADLAVRIYNDDGDLAYAGDPLPAIRIINPACPSPLDNMTPVSIQFGDRLTLRAYAWQQDGDTARLALDWTTGAATGDDLALFVHFMRGDDLVATADRPPIAAYPAHLWLPGQCLAHTSAIDAPPEADRVLIGFYARESLARLPAQSADAPLESDGLVIPLD